MRPELASAWVWPWLTSGLVLTVIVAVALRVCVRASASTRSLAWFSLLLALPLLGFACLLGAPHLLATPELVTPVLPAASTTVTTMPFLATSPTLSSSMASTMSSLVVLAWGLAAVVGLVRLALGVRTLRAWRARCEPLPDTALDHLPVWQALRGTGRPARVVWSRDVVSPCVLGLWSPMIALPRAAAALPAATLDAVLVHEYAHVQRRDDLAQFLQHVIRALCAVHPATWWIDRQLSLEREAACDDWVIALAASPRVYASWMVGLAEQRSAGAALQVAIRGGRSQLAARVRRIVHRRRGRRLAATRTVLGTVPSGMLAASVVTLAMLAPSVPVAVPDRPVPPGMMTARVPRVFEVHVTRPAPDARRDDAAGAVAERSSLASDVPVPPASTASREAMGASSMPAGLLSTTPGARGPRAGAGSVSVAPAHGAVLSHSAGAPLGGTEPRAEAALVTLAPAVWSGAPKMAAMTTDEGDARSADTTPSSSAGARLGTALHETGVALGDASVEIGASVAAAGRHTGTGVARSGAATGGFFSRLGKRVARSF